jgi:adenosylhomocysteine nucleosidase
LFSPEVIYSAGFAGALDTTLSVGDLLVPRAVVDARDSSRIDTGQGRGVLVTCDSVASPDQKANLHRAYSGQAVDMEAAAVARGAQARGVRFAAVKAISDESNFVMPPMERFIAADGHFRAANFALFAALRPWLWGRVAHMMRNSARASRALCRWLSTQDLVGTAIGESIVKCEEGRAR